MSIRNCADRLYTAAGTPSLRGTALLECRFEVDLKVKAYAGREVPAPGRRLAGQPQSRPGA